MVARPSPIVGRRQSQLVEPMEARRMLSGTPLGTAARPATVPAPVLTAAAKVAAKAAVTASARAATAALAKAAKTKAAAVVNHPIAIVKGGPWATPPAQATAARSGGAAAAAVTSAATPAASAYYTPAQVRQFYGVNAVSFNGTAGDGSGQTVAIIDAYADPTVASDLARFSSQYGLPTAQLTVVNQSGGSALPAADAGWATEISLDVDWVHSIAPAAKILLVECDSAEDGDLFAGANYAAGVAGVSAVSMSFGEDEYAGQTAYDPVFNHAGVTFLASTGDTGAAVSYPAESPNVVAVGGTSIYPSDGTGTYGSESAWSAGGGGPSAYEARPAYQGGVNATGARQTPDVSLVADPNTGVVICDNGSYYVVGGTSLSSPATAAMVAIANQGRALAGLASLTGATQTLPRLYQLSAADFHDVTAGSNGHAATAGYDMATGLGTPIANKLLPDLAGGATVGGRAFQDNNANGVYDGTDSAVGSLAGQTVYLDLNNNGSRDTAAYDAEPTTTVSATGTYTFASLVNGGDLPGGLTGTVRLSNGTPVGTVGVGTGSTATTAYRTAATANVGLFPTTFATAAANAAYAVQAAAGSPATLQILVNGTVAYTAPVSLPPSLSFTFTGANDALAVDFGNGNPLAGGLTVNGSAAANGDTLSVLGTAGADAITVNAGTVVFGSSTITAANVPKVTVDPRAGTDALTVNAGAVTLPAQAAGAGYRARTFSALSVANGAKLTVGTAAARTDRTAVVLTAASALSVGATGLLDLGANDLVVRNGSLAAAQALVAAGFAGGTWAGTHGVTSSAAAATRLTALATVLGSQAAVASVDGVSIGSADVLVRYTYDGDANADGVVNAADYSRTDTGYVIAGSTGWANGDFNYDGVVDGSDYSLIDAAFSQQTGPV